MTEILYPQVIPPGVVVKTEAETKAFIDAQLNETKVENNKNRIDKMMLQYEQMNKDLKHYQKIKANWTIGDNVIKYCGMTLVFCAGAATTITTALTVPLLVPAFLSGILTLVPAAQLTLGVGWTSKKKKLYKKKCILIDGYIKKVYVYIEKARDDGIITIEELDGFMTIMKEYELMKSKELPDSTSGNVSEIPLDMDITAMQREIDSQAKQIVMEEMKKQTLQQSVEKYRSKLGLNTPDPPLTATSPAVLGTTPERIV